MRPESTTPRWLLAAGAIFVLAGLGLVLGSLRTKPPSGHSLSSLEPVPAPASLSEVRQLTIDARDPSRWTRIELARATLVDDSGSGSWDLAARRFRLVVNGGDGFEGEGGARRLPGAAFDTVSEAPLDGYVHSRVTPGGDTVNAALERWYRYGFLSHLLEPRDAVFAIRTAEGRYAKLEIVGYYCPGAEPGCLTIRYVYQGDGSRRLAE